LWDQQARTPSERASPEQRPFVVPNGNPADNAKQHSFDRLLPNPLRITNGGVMQAQLITYQLGEISQAEYLKQMVEPDAPVLANVPGLISKVWLADEEKNSFGGFYLWEDKAAMNDFMHSDLVKAVVSRPFVRNVSSVDFEVNENASLVTRGLK
jgi:hypothetical protein